MKRKPRHEKTWNELTFHEKLADIRDLFEFKACDECGKGFEAHDVCELLGNPFLKCRISR
jgi:hypothetical protein